MDTVLRGTPRTTSSFTLGQQFYAVDIGAPGETELLTVTRISRDRFGLAHVTFTRPDGREISAFAEQVEAAIAEKLIQAIEEMAGLVS